MVEDHETNKTSRECHLSILHYTQQENKGFHDVIITGTLYIQVVSASREPFFLFPV